MVQLTIMEDLESIKIGSYNCRSIQSKKEYVNTLLFKVDILCVQEHWLSELQLSFLGSINELGSCMNRYL